MKRNFVALVTVLALAASSAAAADTFTVDAAHTKVGFSVTHMLISEVEGKFKEFSGEIVWDEADPAKSLISGSIKAASVDTDEQKRDDHLRSADFFDVAKYPEITFKSSKIEKAGSDYVVTGQFTLHGVSKELKVPLKVSQKVTDPWGNVRMAFKGDITINRKDYGLTWNKTLDAGGLAVGDEVKISLVAEGILKK